RPVEQLGAIGLSNCLGCSRRGSLPDAAERYDLGFGARPSRGSSLQAVVGWAPRRTHAQTITIDVTERIIACRGVIPLCMGQPLDLLELLNRLFPLPISGQLGDLRVQVGDGGLVSGQLQTFLHAGEIRSEAQHFFPDARGLAPLLPSHSRFGLLAKLRYLPGRRDRRLL